LYGLYKFLPITVWYRIRCGSAAVLLLGLWARIPPRAWRSVSFVSCVLSGRVFSYEPRRVLTDVVRDPESSAISRPTSTRVFKPLKTNFWTKISHTLSIKFVNCGLSWKYRMRGKLFRKFEWNIFGKILYIYAIKIF
jgi:hypothetical protein